MIKKEEKSQESSFQFDDVTRDQFLYSISEHKADRFAKTFIAKCDMLNAWDQVIGLWDNDQLAGAILTTISKRAPLIANLQLLHTFYAYRKQGVARKLCDKSLAFAHSIGANYFRVSSEIDAIPFYEKIGIKFLGKQKSGCQLAMFRVTSSEYATIDYAVDDVIYKAATKKGKGGCVELFFDYRVVDKFTE